MNAHVLGTGRNKTPQVVTLTTLLSSDPEIKRQNAARKNSHNRAFDKEEEKRPSAGC